MYILFHSIFMHPCEQEQPSNILSTLAIKPRGIYVIRGEVLDKNMSCFVFGLTHEGLWISMDI